MSAKQRCSTAAGKRKQRNSKKGFSTIILFFIGILLFIGVVVVVIIVLTQGDILPGESQKNVSKPIEMFLKAKDAVSSQYVNAHYLVYDPNFTQEGNLRYDAYTPIKVPSDQEINIFCWNDDYYVQGIKSFITPRDIEFNKSKVDCLTARIGILDIKRIAGDLSNLENTIIFNISAKDGWWEEPGFCIAWSASIITASCQDFNETAIPKRLNGLVDKCYYIGGELKVGDSRKIICNVETISQKNDLDYISFTFFDQERKYLNGNWTWYSEYDNRNLGAFDFEYRIDYN